MRAETPNYADAGVNRVLAAERDRCNVRSQKLPRGYDLDLVACREGYAKLATRIRIEIDRRGVCHCFLRLKA